VLVNAQHIKAVPGRKTDVKDAEWLADLLQHGLLRSSFVPSVFQRQVREVTRYRASLIEERSRAVNRLQKILEGANIKLASVASDVMGVSARAMLEALLEGEGDPRTLAQLAHGRLRSKRDLLAQALQGRFTAHHRFLIREQLAHIDGLEEHIAALSKEIAERLRPFETQLKHLETIPGIKRRLAEVIEASIGADMSRFRKSRGIWLRGLACVLATMRVQASV
jgi:transposase